MLLLPLAGIRVLEIGTMVAGPYAGAVLADLGAEVLKLEPREGETLRRSVAFAGTEHWFTECNRGKKSLALDLTAPRGRELLWDLVGRSDAVLYNIRPDTVAKLGLADDVLRTVNPRIVVVQVSAFGGTGPWGNRRGTAPTIDGSSGITFVNGDEQTGPLKPPNLFGDLAAALFAALAVAAGLRSARQSVTGGFTDVAMTECVSHLLSEAILEELVLGEPRLPHGNEHPYAAPHGCYPCAGDDSWIAIAIETDNRWRLFGEIAGDWTDAPEYADLPSRHQNRAALDADISRWTQGHDAVSLMATLQAAGIPSATVASPLMVSEDPQLSARGYFGAIDVLGIAQPIPRFAGRPGLDRSDRAAAPEVSADADAILGEILELTRAEIEELYTSGICTPPKRQ